MLNLNHSTLIICVVTLSALQNNNAIAQIVPDNTLGAESSTIRSVDNLKNAIEGGVIREENLFHSFQEFGIKEGFTTEFTNPEGIVNIFSRVTGGNISEILGTLAVDGSANLFLMNPNGIVFGENTAIDVAGSFIATTAESVEFDNGKSFSTVNLDEPLLTINFPIGLGFGSTPGNIVVRDSGHNFKSQVSLPPSPLNESVLDLNRGLSIAPNNTLALLGGNVSIEGGILASQAGRLEIGSIKNGKVNFSSDSKGFAFDYKEVNSFNNINLSSKSFLSASGNQGGSININANKLDIDNSSIVFIENRGSNTTSGNLSIEAVESINFQEKEANNFFSGLLSTQTINSGTAGNIIVNTSNLKASDVGLIVSSNYGGGKGGNVSVNSNNLIATDGTNIGTGNYGEGKGGNVSVNSNEIKVLGTENPELNAAQTIIGSSNFGSGVGGDVFVKSDNLIIRDGGTIGSGSISSGDGGDVFIESESIHLSGINKLVGIPLSSLSASTLGSGAAGNLSIDTSSLVVDGGAEVSSSTLGSGNAGKVTINSSNIIRIEGFSFIDRKPSQIVAGGNNVELPAIFTPVDVKVLGESGGIELNTPLLEIIDSAAITVRNSGMNNAGNLQINAEQINLDDAAQISASTLSGEGGNIILNTDNLKLFNLSQITATAGGAGNGGNITINSDNILGYNNSDITANAVEGNGGNIEIDSDLILGIEQSKFLTPYSDITASSELGIDGTVTINSPDTNAEDEVLFSAKSPEPDRVEKLFDSSCLNPNRSRLARVILRGRGLPETPYNYFDRPSEEIETPVEAVRQPKVKPDPQAQELPPAIIEPNAIEVDESGRRFLVALSPKQIQSARVCQQQLDSSHKKSY